MRIIRPLTHMFSIGFNNAKNAMESFSKTCSDDPIRCLPILAESVLLQAVIEYVKKSSFALKREQISVWCRQSAQPERKSIKSEGGTEWTVGSTFEMGERVKICNDLMGSNQIDWSSLSFENQRRFSLENLISRIWDYQSHLLLRMACVYSDLSTLCNASVQVRSVGEVKGRWIGAENQRKADWTRSFPVESRFETQNERSSSHQQRRQHWN